MELTWFYCGWCRGITYYGFKKSSGMCWDCYFEFDKEIERLYRDLGGEG